jgi:hypothetical protein
MPKKTCKKSELVRSKEQGVKTPSLLTAHSSRVYTHPILTFSKGKLVKFYFEGKELEGYEGEPIAAALIANDIKVFRITEKMKRPRGFFCAVGKCSSCLMTVDSKPNVMVCVEPLKEGMQVEKQKGRGKLK